MSSGSRGRGLSGASTPTDRSAVTSGNWPAQGASSLLSAHGRRSGHGSETMTTVAHAWFLQSSTTGGTPTGVSSLPARAPTPTSARVSGLELVAGGGPPDPLRRRELWPCLLPKGPHLFLVSRSTGPRTRTPVDLSATAWTDLDVCLLPSDDRRRRPTSAASPEQQGGREVRLARHLPRCGSPDPPAPHQVAHAEIGRAARRRAQRRVARDRTVPRMRRYSRPRRSLGNRRRPCGEPGREHVRVVRPLPLGRPVTSVTSPRCRRHSSPRSA
jgi:hypothetical protein